MIHLASIVLALVAIHAWMDTVPPAADVAAHVADDAFWLVCMVTKIAVAFAIMAALAQLGNALGVVT